MIADVKYLEYHRQPPTWPSKDALDWMTAKCHNPYAKSEGIASLAIDPVLIATAENKT